MGKGIRRREAREQKYSASSKPPKPSNHGKPPKEPEKVERWQ